MNFVEFSMVYGDEKGKLIHEFENYLIDINYCYKLLHKFIFDHSIRDPIIKLVEGFYDTIHGIMWSNLIIQTQSIIDKHKGTRLSIEYLLKVIIENKQAILENDVRAVYTSISSERRELALFRHNMLAHKDIKSILGNEVKLRIKLETIRKIIEACNNIMNRIRMHNGIIALDYNEIIDSNGIDELAYWLRFGSDASEYFNELILRSNKGDDKIELDEIIQQIINIKRGYVRSDRA